jgi:hypothetical protein
MSATSAATILPFPRVPSPPGLDVTGLLRFACFFHSIHESHIEVLDDEDGDVARFLCRAPRAAFDTREAFMAAATKRYLGCVTDPRLAEMIFVACLYQAGTGARVSEDALRERLAEAFDGQPPPGWSDHLGGPDFLDVAMLSPGDDHLLLVVRGRQWWVYAQVEG